MAPVQVASASAPRPYDRGVILSTWASVIALFLASSAGVVIHKAVPGAATAVRTGTSEAAASTTTTTAAGAASPVASTSTTAATHAAAAPAPKPIAVATAAPTASAGTPQDPGPPTPPRPGTYKQRLTTTTNGSTTTSDLTVKIENEASSAGSTTQRLTASTDKGTSVSEVSWKPDAVRMLSNTFGTGQNAATCTWQPPIETLPIPVTTGATWSSDSSCTISAYGQTEKVHETVQAKVARLERITEAGTAIDCWVMSRVVHIDGTGMYPFTIDTTSTDWFSPKYGEIVKSESETKSSGTYNGQTTSSQTHMTTEAVTIDPQ
jgi:hypothetical protein